MTSTFEMNDNGLFRVTVDRNGDENYDFISQFFTVRGVGCANDSSDWGIIINFETFDGYFHQKFIKKGDLQKSKSDWLVGLSNDGFTLFPSKKTAFIDYIARLFNEYKDKILFFPDKTGWHKYNGKYIYALPDRTIPDVDDVIPCIEEKIKIGTQGTYEEWQKITRYAIDNPPYTIAMLTPLASTLMHLAKLDIGYIVHYSYTSSAGKTLSARIASSMFTKYDDIKTSWDYTSNNIASRAMAFNDNCIIMDEIGTAKKNADIGKIVYDLANGIGRGKNNINDIMKKTKTWRCFTFSTGEKSLKEYLQSTGKEMTAGQEVRFLNIPLSPELYHSLHGFDSGSDIAKEIVKIADENYGFAGPMFVEHIVDNYEKYSAILPDAVQKITSELAPKNSSDQFIRSARCFGLMKITGRIAKEIGIFPQELDTDAAVEEMFNAWKDDRSSVTETSEAVAFVNKVKDFIRKYYNTRFVDVDDISYGQNTPQGVMGYREAVRKNNVPEYYRYFIRSSTLLEIAGSDNLDLVASALDKANMLYTTAACKNKKSRQKQVQRKFTGMKMERFFCIDIPSECENEVEDDLDTNSLDDHHTFTPPTRSNLKSHYARNWNVA